MSHCTKETVGSLILSETFAIGCRVSRDFYIDHVCGHISSCVQCW